MHSQSISKTIALAVIAVFALLLTVESQVGAQEFFSGQGISGAVTGTSPSLSGPFGAGLGQPSSNPIAGIFKKPAFLENLKVPTIEFKKPSFDMFSSAGSNQAGTSFLSGLPKLSNLIPQREPGQLSLLGKMKSKTDAFFSKAFAFEKLMPGRQSSTQDSSDWDAVRQTMEETLAAQETRARQATERTANAASGSLTR